MLVAWSSLLSLFEVIVVTTVVHAEVGVVLAPPVGGLSSKGAVVVTIRCAWMLKCTLYG